LFALAARYILPEYTRNVHKYMRRYRLTYRATTDDMPWEREPVSTGFQCHLLRVVLSCRPTEGAKSNILWCAHHSRTDVRFLRTCNVSRMSRTKFALEVGEHSAQIVREWCAPQDVTHFGPRCTKCRSILQRDAMLACQRLTCTF
jgi:hypothetical protein